MGTTFASLRSGAWGVRTTEDVQPGDRVTVTTRKGDTRIETIDRVIWSGPDRETGETVRLCAILPSLPPTRTSKPNRPRRTVRRTTQRIGRAEVDTIEDMGDFDF